MINCLWGREGVGGQEHVYTVWSVYLGWSQPCQELCQQVEKDKESHIHFPHNWTSAVIPSSVGEGRASL